MVKLAIEVECLAREILLSTENNNSLCNQQKT
jgi:hypothetical protein